VFWRRAGEGAGAYRPNAATATPAMDPAPVAIADRRILVSSQAMEQLYEFAPRWDKHYLENLYIAWAKNTEPARNEDARFLSWVRSYTKGKPAP